MRCHPRYPAVVFLILWGVAGVAGGQELLPAFSDRDLLAGRGGSVRAYSMGRALVGEADGASSVELNPAGLGLLESPEAAFGHYIGLADIRDNLIAVALPLRGRWGAGLRARYLDYGKFPGSDEEGNITSPFRADQWSVDLGAGAELADGFAVGGTLRATRQALADVSYRYLHADAGVLYRIHRVWGLGASVANLGLSRESVVSRPVFRFGASRPVRLTSALDLMAAFSLTHEPRTGSDLGAGLEVRLERALYLRGGMRRKLREDGLGGARGFTAGVGLKAKGARFDYAFEPFGDFGNTHWASLTYRFGEKEEDDAVDGAYGAQVPKAGKAKAQKAHAKTGTAVEAKGSLADASRVEGTSGADASGSTEGSKRVEQGEGQVDSPRGTQDGLSTGPSGAAGVGTGSGKNGDAVRSDQEGSDGSKPERLKLRFDLGQRELDKGAEWERKGRNREAFVVYQMIVEKNPSNEEAWWRLGNLYYREKMKEPAMRCFGEVLRLKPGDRELAEWLEKYRKSQETGAPPH